MENRFSYSGEYMGGSLDSFKSDEEGDDTAGTDCASYC
jgi:hypothetical protein